MLLGLVADAVQALRGCVRLNLLCGGDVVEFENEARLGALHLQLFDAHVLQRAGLELPAAVGRGVDDVQLLAGGLVQ